MCYCFRFYVNTHIIGSASCWPIPPQRMKRNSDNRFFSHQIPLHEAFSHDTPLHLKHTLQRKPCMPNEFTQLQTLLHQKRAHCSKLLKTVWAREPCTCTKKCLHQTARYLLHQKHFHTTHRIQSMTYLSTFGDVGSQTARLQYLRSDHDFWLHYYNFIFYRIQPAFSRELGVGFNTNSIQFSITSTPTSFSTSSWSSASTITLTLGCRQEHGAECWWYFVVLIYFRQHILHPTD